MDISVIIPVYNEEGTLRELSERIMHVFEKENYKGEIIFINDGSTDKTPEILNALDSEQMFIRAIHFHRNKGKAAALQAGFEEAKGNFVITMDGDLQDEPSEIPALIAKLEEGFDIVSGWKKNGMIPSANAGPQNYSTASPGRCPGSRSTISTAD